METIRIHGVEGKFIIKHIESVLEGNNDNSLEYFYEVLKNPSKEADYWLDLIYKTNITHRYIFETRLLASTLPPGAINSVERAEDVLRDAALNEAFADVQFKITKEVLKHMLLGKQFEKILDQNIGNDVQDFMRYSKYVYDKFLANVEQMISEIKHPPAGISASEFDIVSILQKKISFDYAKYVSKVNILGRYFDDEHMDKIVATVILRLMQFYTEYRPSSTFVYWFMGSINKQYDNRMINIVKQLLKPEFNSFDIAISLLGLDNESQEFKDKLYRMIHNYGFGVFDSIGGRNNAIKKAVKNFDESDPKLHKRSESKKA